MNYPNLWFRKIEVRRMPGFPNGGLLLDDFCEGVNVVYGPNASGKTTLGRAIGELLHPTRPAIKERSLFAAVRVQGRDVTIDCDMDRVRVQQDGQELDEPRDFAPEDVRDRYVLALHDLIRVEDGRDLAAEIVRESAGGYDVGEARDKLEFRDKPRGKSNKATKELDRAIADCRKVQQKQDELVGRERELAELRRRHEEAGRAALELQWLDKAIALDEARGRHDAARAKVDAFPEGMAWLTGNEIQRLVEIRKVVSAARQDRIAQEDRLRRAEAAKDECRLPEEGLPTDLPGTLRQKCQRLQALAAEIASQRQAREKAAAEARHARERLGADAERSSGAAIDQRAVDELAKFAWRAETVRAEASAAAALGQWLQPDDAEPEDPEPLGEAVKLVERWSAREEAARPGAPPRKWPLLLAAALVAVVAVAMAVAVHLSWLLALVGSAALALWAFWPRAGAYGGWDVRGELERLGVGMPPSWSAADVAAFVREIRRRRDQAGLGHEKSARWHHLASRRDELERQTEELQREKQGLIERLGLPLDAAETDPTWLYVLAEGLVRLHQAEKDLAAADAGLVEAERQHAELLGEVNRHLEQYGTPPAADADAASARVEDLARRGNSHQQARSEIHQAEESLAKIDGDLGRLAQEEAGVFDRLGLTPDDEPLLRQWMDSYDEYAAAVKDLGHAQGQLAGAEAALADRPDLAERPREELEQSRERCRKLVAELDKINQEIGRIEGAVAAAKRATDLEAALARVDAAKDALREVRAADGDALVGDAIADFLSRRQQDEHQPAVFRRAQELFVRITQGRYELGVHAGDPPAFRAKDTSRGVGLALDELSSGTRLQLLLTARLAFVERQERDLKLPLVFDETLGNSDERRAGEIIDAAIAVCRQGRQVFYFTAQYDEMWKWKRVLRHEDVPHKLIDLAEVRGFSESERVPPLEWDFPEPPAVPPPGDADWLAYGRVLNVPGLDPRGEVGDIHLWYLVDDPAVLYRLLKGGINRWGQLQALAAYEPDETLGTDSETFRKAQAAARALEALCRLWRTGRGEPVDRRVLAESGAVSENFLDDVADLARELGGDARRLLEALDAGRVSGFRRKKAADLREYFDDRGYLDDRRPLSDEEIRRQARVSAFADVQQGRLTTTKLEQLAALVLGAPAAHAQPSAGRLF